MKCGHVLRSTTRSSIPTMTTEYKSTRKRAYLDENPDTSAFFSPRKRQAIRSSGSSATTLTNTSSENTPGPCIVQSSYFSPSKKASDSVRKRRLLAASHSLLNENNRFVKRLSGTASPAEPAESRKRDQQNVVETTAAITEHLVSELSKSKSRKRGTRKVPEPIALEEIPVEKSDLTALEKQVRVRVIIAHIVFNLRHFATGIKHKETLPGCRSYVRGWL